MDRTSYGAGMETFSLHRGTHIMLKSPLKSFADEVLTFMIAFAILMPWTALDTAESALSGANSFAQESGVVHVAVASDYSSPLPAQGESGTVAALFTWVQEALSSEESVQK